MPGWRAADNLRTKRVGVAADDLDAFLRKACDKLRKDYRSSKCYVAEDGTLVTDNDYFKTLKPQTLLIIVDRGETMKTDIDLEFERCERTNYVEAGKIIQKYFDEHPELLREFKDKVKSEAENKAHLSKKEEHEDWFSGIKQFNTKEDFMANTAEIRVKGYLSRAKTPINKKDEFLDPTKPTQRKIKAFWKDLDTLLKENNYHSYYFNRLSKNDEKFCDEKGNFKCEGKWNANECFDNETINPYSSKAERIIFKSWNLDHGIELSRSIIPSIVKAIDAISNKKFTCYKCNGSCMDGYIAADLYYDLLFTRNNIKLVSDICHDKSKHGIFEDVYVVCRLCKY